jgi:YHS domain-containing protein
VKLNANENSATATGFGITRVPTDVILTPDGHVVGKLISPPTPAGYVAELSQIAAAYTSTPGQGFLNAASQAPSPSNINVAYANLPVGSSVIPAAESIAKTQAPGAQAMRATLGVGGTATTPSTRDPFQASGVVSNRFAAPVNPATSAAAGGFSTTQAGVAPAGLSQSAAGVSPIPNSVAAPIAAPALSDPPSPGQIENRYAAVPVSPPPTAAAQPLTPAWPAPPPGPAAAVNPGNNPAQLSLQTEATPPLPTSQQSTLVVQPTANTKMADGRQLPPGAPPLGFEGFCPVSMRNHWKWVPGDPRWGIVHRGRTYWFANQAEQQQFWADPDRYSPALSGMDPVLAIDHQQQVSGKREHSIDYDGLFYLFSCEATLAQFTANPERYAASVRQAMGIPRGRLVR